MSLVMTAAEICVISNGDYHADLSRVSHSMLKVFSDSPLTYQARFITQTIPSPESSPQMCLGTALHALILEPERFDEYVVVAPDFDRRTKDGKLQWESFHCCVNGRTVITQDQNQTATLMAKSILSHPEAVKLIRRAEHRETAIYWTNEASGVRCKAKPDILWAKGAVIGDIKTANDPTPGAWARQAASLGYAKQTAHYSNGVEALLGTYPKMVHIVVGSAPPYECACYFISQEDIDHAAFQVQKALNELAEAYATGIWAAPHNREIKVVSLPRWTRYDD